MTFGPLTDEQVELRELVRTLVADKIAPRAAEVDASGEFPWDVVQVLRDHDILALPFEERYGGLGMGTLMTVVAIEEISKACATTGLILSMQDLSTIAIRLHGTDEQKERYLPRIASRRVARGVRADRARGRLRRGCADHDREARG